jgi:hypothetical protein
LPENWRNKCELLLSFQHTNLLLIHSLNWFPLEVIPLSEKLISLSEDCVQKGRRLIPLHVGYLLPDICPVKSFASKE